LPGRVARRCLGEAVAVGWSAMPRKPVTADPSRRRLLPAAAAAQLIVVNFRGFRAEPAGITALRGVAHAIAW
jgi:hypothetical protein